MHGASLRSDYALVADRLDGQCSAEFCGLGVRQMGASRGRRYGRLVCVYDVKDLTGLGLHARHSLDIIKV